MPFRSTKKNPKFKIKITENFFTLSGVHFPLYGTERFPGRCWYAVRERVSRHVCAGAYHQQPPWGAGVMLLPHFRSKSKLWLWEHQFLANNPFDSCVWIVYFRLFCQSFRGITSKPIAELDSYLSKYFGTCIRS